MKKILIITLLMALILTVSSLNNYPVGFTLQIDNDNLTLGDNLLVKADIHNQNDYMVSLYIVSHLENLKGTYVDFPVDFYIDLEADETKTIIVYNYTIDEYYDEDEYTITVNLKQDGQIIDNGDVGFIVYGTGKNIDLEILACKDIDCQHSADVFYEGEEVFINYLTDIQDLNLKSALSHNLTATDIDLPTYIIPQKRGTYIVDIVASKEGYRTLTASKKFGVIEEKYIPIKQACNEDGLCNNDENIQNCPQDCTIVIEFDDADDDGIPDMGDNCKDNYNPDQADTDEDGIGDVCNDEDDDGIIDMEDMCDNTVIPESVPTQKLNVNRFALVDDDKIFDTTSPKGKGPSLEFTLFDTHGCSCEQILQRLGIPKKDKQGLYKYGCSLGIMREWTK